MKRLIVQRRALRDITDADHKLATFSPVNRHCERSAAVHRCFSAVVDCRASLAMTAGVVTGSWSMYGIEPDS
jgi:hypothetical protein